MGFICNQCPRKCNAERRELDGDGYCRMGYAPKLARAALHFWEEPCISGTRGSGTVFFSGCSLGCIYCQNYSISHEDNGKIISTDRLIEIFKELESLGAHNINLVNPTHYTHVIIEALSEYKPSVPVVYNSSGYEDLDSLRSLDGLIDIYLPDFKYIDSELSAKLSGAVDYFDISVAAINEMYRQTGRCTFDNDGIMQKGVIVRHLVLPGFISKSIKTLEYIKNNFPTDIFVSIMAQYTPAGDVKGFKTLERRLNSREYNRILDTVEMLGFENGFVQELSSAKEEYIPPFDLTGL